MALPAINGLALCAGVGMLDEGCRLAFEHLGFDYRTVAYVERESFAASQLVALMETGCLDTAPVWSDLTTFDGKQWRGLVDCITAGFPCQPHSVAGKRAGLEDERWIWPDIARLIGDVGPRFVLLENVPGLASTGGLGACLGDLAALGFDAEWGLLSAADVGAAHTRERLFILAYSGSGAIRRNSRAASGAQAADGRRSEEHGNGAERLCDIVAYARCEHEHVQQRLQRAPEHPGSGSELEHADGAGLGTGRERERGAPDDAQEGNSVDDARRTERWPQSFTGGSGESRGYRGRQTAGRTGESVEAVAESCSARSSQRTGGGSDDGALRSSVGTDIVSLRRTFAPGPGDQSWEGYCTFFYHLAPALESGVCGMVDGLALVVDESRADQLRAIGNGVVPLQAAAAFVQLARRAMT